jgi:ribonuclease Z
MKATFLGTAGSFPTPRRGAPAIAIQIGSQLILLDCGEGTQRQMAMARIGLKTKTRILITHMHGDHVLGLPGILQTMSLFSRVAPLRIYGPEGIAAFVEATRETVKFNPTYPIEVVETGEGIVYEEKEYFVESAFMKHSIPALGYSLSRGTGQAGFIPRRLLNPEFQRDLFGESCRKVRQSSLPKEGQSPQRMLWDLREQVGK